MFPGPPLSPRPLKGPTGTAVCLSPHRDWHCPVCTRASQSTTSTKYHRVEKRIMQISWRWKEVMCYLLTQTLTSDLFYVLGVRLTCDTMFIMLTCCPGYSHVNSTATSCSPITVQVTRRLSPIVIELDDAWITGAGGAMGSEGQGRIINGNTGHIVLLWVYMRPSSAITEMVIAFWNINGFLSVRQPTWPWTRTISSIWNCYCCSIIHIHIFV